MEQNQDFAAPHELPRGPESPTGLEDDRKDDLSSAAAPPPPSRVDDASPVPRARLPGSPQRTPARSAAARSRSGSASPRERSHKTSPSKKKPAHFKHHEKFDFFVGLQHVSPSHDAVVARRGRFPREAQLLPPVHSHELEPVSPTLARFLEPRGPSSSAVWWKAPTSAAPVARAPPAAAAAPSLRQLVGDAGSPWRSDTAGSGVGDADSPTPHAPRAVAVSLDSAAHAAPLVAVSVPRFVGGDRATALAAACAAHGSRLVSPAQDAANSVLVAARGEKSPRVPLFHLARYGVNVSLLQDKAASRVPLKLASPHGIESIFAAVPVVETGDPDDGLFFLRADLRVLGLAFATYKNGKWDGLYAARDFPDSELARAFGADWFAGAAEPPDEDDEGAESTLGPFPTTPLPPARRVPAGGERRAQPDALLRSRSSAAADLESGSAARSATLMTDGYTAGSKRKASALLHNDVDVSAALISEALMRQLRLCAPALIDAAQDPSSTTVIAWPHPLPSFDGALRRSGNREALSVLARFGMTPDQLSDPLTASDVAALQLQRARAGNAKAGAGAYPVVPIFSTGGHSEESVICVNHGRDVVGLAVLFKRCGEMWKKSAIALPVSALSREQLAELFDTGGGLAPHAAVAAWNGTGDSMDDVGDDEVAAQLLQHVQSSIIAPLTPLPSSPAWRPLRDSAVASLHGSRSEHLHAAMISFGPALLAASASDTATAQISFRGTEARITVALNDAVRQGVPAALLAASIAVDLSGLVVKRARSGNSPGGPFPVLPVMDSLTGDAPLFLLGGDECDEGRGVYDLALAVKGPGGGWRGAELVSFRRLADAHLDELFGTDSWSGAAAASPTASPGAASCSAPEPVSPLHRSPRAAAAAASTLTGEHLRLLVLAAQAHSSTTMIKMPGSADIASLSSVARAGALAGQLESPSLQRLAGSLLLASVGMGRASPDAGVFPVIPLLDGKAAHGTSFFHGGGTAHGAAVALKVPEKASHRWRDRSVTWVDVVNLSTAQTAMLVAAAQRLTGAEVTPDAGKTEDYEASSPRSVPRISSAGESLATATAHSWPAVPSSSAPCAATNDELINPLLSDLELRARALGVVPRDAILAARLFGLLREAVEAGFLCAVNASEIS